MKTLHLLRHAKSSWKDPGLDDHDRPLSKRGRETARAIAAYLRRAKIAPDLVICSTAVRARQTLDSIAKAIKPPKVVLEKRIYEVAREKIWKHLWRLPKSADCVLLIGHNPGLHDLALALADADSGELVPPRPARQAAKAKKITTKAALVTQAAKETAKANKTATKTTVQRTKASTPKARPKRVTAAKKAPSDATTVAANVARQSSAMRSITPRPVTSPAGS